MTENELVDKVIKKLKLIENQGYFHHPIQFGEKAKELIDLIRGSEWISVEELDRLPEEGDLVWVHRDVGDFQRVEPYTWDRWAQYNGVTHHCRLILPSPPTNKGESK